MSGIKRVSPQSVHARPTAIKIATLGIAWLQQERHLRVRQTEELRRALATAAEFRGWIASGPDPAAPALKDVASLTRAGSKQLAMGLAEELAAKKKEPQEQKKISNSIQKLADKKKGWDEPIEIEYFFTGREGDRLATKTEVFTLANQDEARDAVALMEKKSGSWETLRNQLLEDIKGRQKQVKGLDAELQDFVEFTRSLIHEVLAILH
jgi:hypothetical protein